MLARWLLVAVDTWTVAVAVLLLASALADRDGDAGGRRWCSERRTELPNELLQGGLEHWPGRRRAGQVSNAGTQPGAGYDAAGQAAAIERRLFASVVGDGDGGRGDGGTSSTIVADVTIATAQRVFGIAVDSCRPCPRGVAGVEVERCHDVDDSMPSILARRLVRA